MSSASAGKESSCNAGGPGLILGLGRSAGEGIGYLLQHSWASLVAQLVKNPPTMAGDLGLIPGFDPWMGKIPWRRGKLPTPVFWPGEFHGLYSPWGHKELGMTELPSLSLSVWKPTCRFRLPSSLHPQSHPVTHRVLMILPPNVSPVCPFFPSLHRPPASLAGVVTEESS